MLEVNADRIAKRWCLAGYVQGQGVRPRLARLARQLALAGSLRNTLQGLLIELEGPAASLAEFERRIAESLPTSGHLTGMSSRAIDPTGRCGVVIELERSEEPNAALSAPVPTDRVVCGTCLDELRNPADRRSGYALTTCAECGPRFTLIRAMPFERAQTSLADFPLCPACQREYGSADDRRYHAQTTSCECCGPRLWTCDGGPHSAVGREAINVAVRSLVEGQILALCGVGGYQLLCDATDDVAVRRLRERKHRVAKPLAVLVRDLAQARVYAWLAPAEEDALESPSNPIVIVRARCESALAGSIHPGLSDVGLLLPTTPLHWLLVERCGKPLVCTSGNREGEPLVVRPAEAEQGLSGLADVWLHHDRRIERPVDDSVVRVIAGRAVTLRLGRGLAPLSLELQVPRPQVALGGQLKHALAWSNGAQVVLGPHGGDLDSLAARERFAAQLADVQQLYRFRSQCWLHDAHPDYFTTRWAESQSELTWACQHHAAHVAAALLEHGLGGEPAVGVAWDGTGWGTDGRVWGGEWFRWDPTRGLTHLARLRPLALPGGEWAIRQPWRMALSVLRDVWPFDDLRVWARQMYPDQPVERLIHWLQSSRSPPLQTTSVGRLFDAVASILLGITHADFEGQPAMLLEAISTRNADRGYACAVTELPDGRWELDWRPLVRELLTDVQRGESAAVIGGRFHLGLAQMVECGAARCGSLPRVLSGGVFQNRLLVERLVEVTSRSTRLGLPGRIPPNDGGLAAGQLALATWTARAAGRLK